LKYFLSFRIFEQLELGLKTELALNFSIRGGRARPPRPPVSYATAYEIGEQGATLHSGSSKCYVQGCRQDFAAGGQKPQEGATFKKYNIGCMQQSGAKHEMGSTGFKWGDGHHCPPHWRQPFSDHSSHFE